MRVFVLAAALVAMGCGGVEPPAAELPEPPGADEEAEPYPPCVVYWRCGDTTHGVAVHRDSDGWVEFERTISTHGLEECTVAVQCIPTPAG